MAFWVGIDVGGETFTHCLPEGRRDSTSVKEKHSLPFDPARTGENSRSAVRYLSGPEFCSVNRGHLGVSLP